MTTLPKKNRESMWLGTLAPKLRSHSRWFRGGRVGEGRIVMSDQNLQGAKVSNLEGARFERCDFSGGVFSLMSEIELVGCVFDDCGMNNSSWRRASIADCSFRGAWLGLTQFEDASIEGGDWLGAYLERISWTRARVRDVNFRAAWLTDARWDEATFVNCSFHFANLSRMLMKADSGRCPNVRFERCDFRNANLSGLRLMNTVFDHCHFHDAIGAPSIEGPYTVIAPDFSAAGDGSDVRDSDELRARWERGEARP